MLIFIWPVLMALLLLLRGYPAVNELEELSATCQMDFFCNLTDPFNMDWMVELISVPLARWRHLVNVCLLVVSLQRHTVIKS